MRDTERLIFEFKRIFGQAPEAVSFAPGRVNLIGEHTDYNGGHVLPCALEVGTLCAARKRDDGLLRLCSLNLPGLGAAEETLDGITPLSLGGWTAYPTGVIGALRDAGYETPRGMDMLFWGDVPAGAGLSSSAAMEVAAGLMLCGLFGFDIGRTKLACLCREAENRYVGMNCGVMDQFASAMGKEGCAVYLDTSTLEYALAPLAMPDHRIVIVNSGVKHSLAGSAYNKRREECEQALKILAPVTGKTALCGITPEEFEASRGLLEGDVLKRARHAVYEEARTKEAYSVLTNGGLEEFGRLMNESHISLRDDYEVSCAELDILTELAWSTPGVLGARMTGGGFGGCMISIVRNDAVDEFTRKVGEGYAERTGIEAEFTFASPSEGARMTEI